MVFSSDSSHGDSVIFPPSFQTGLWAPELSDPVLSSPPIACSHFFCCPTSLLITTFKRSHALQTSQALPRQFSTCNSLISAWCNTTHCTDASLHSRRRWHCSCNPGMFLFSGWVSSQLCASKTCSLLCFRGDSTGASLTATFCCPLYNAEDTNASSQETALLLMLLVGSEALFLENVFMAAVLAVSQSTHVPGKAWWYLLGHFCLRSSGSVIQRCTHWIILP